MCEGVRMVGDRPNGKVKCGAMLSVFYLCSAG
jgi:hypothetical protein